MRKKLLSIFIICLLLSLTALGVVACNREKKPTSLDTPVVSVGSRGVATWKAIEGAEYYELRINSVLYSTENTSFDLLTIDNLPSDNQFTVRVRAVNGKVYSEWSKIIAYSHTPMAMATPVLKVLGRKLLWTPNTNATKVVVTVNGVATELPGTAYEFDLSTFTGNCLITVQFIGDGMTSADSAIASIAYNGATGKGGLPAPQNVRMEGYVLTFDAVPGANIYYLLDVNNNITTITSNRSDRAKSTLVKSVWAGDTTDRLDDSERADVTYFTEGDGTQSNPFMIGSPAELRFIEFYEAQNQAMYYKFKNDVVLNEYAPGEEEVYNNFYNLGSLSGVIDGNGYKLVNSVVYFCDGYSSLFDSITPGGVIKNLVIDNANFRTWTVITNDGIMHEKGGECAILAYTNRGTIDNVTVTNSNVCAVKDGAAALVSINKGTIKNSTIESSTHIYGANEAGGIAIFNSGKIVNCINRADVSGKTTIGGIVGRNNGLVSQCGNEGKITATTYGGGIVGYNYNINDGGLQFDSLISQCYNYGEVNVVSYGGGIAGKNGGDGINEVGKESYANAGIFSCYNRGAIKGANSLGGIVGDNYGFHEVSSDLGVVNCYNSGAISVDSSALKSIRVYLSLENCSWGTVDGAVFYMHYWGAAGESSWPGVRMTQITVSGKTYYYADMSITAEQLTGVIFNRCNPTNGDIWNQSEDILTKVSSGNLLYKIDNSWRQATTASSASLINNTPLSVGGIAGFNNMVNDCYFLAAKVNNSTLQAGVAQGTQYNKTVLNGKTVQSSACEITQAQLSTFATTLNAYANVWEDSANGPVLKWQRR